MGFSFKGFDFNVDVALAQQILRYAVIPAILLLAFGLRKLLSPKRRRNSGSGRPRVPRSRAKSESAALPLALQKLLPQSSTSPQKRLTELPAQSTREQRSQ